MEWIVEFLGNYAFPIVMCLLLYKQNNEQDKRHAEETTELSKVISNNTAVIQQLASKIDNMEDKIR